MLKKFNYFLLALLGFSLVACAASPTSESTGQYLDSTAITTKVKANLVDQLGTKAFAIKVKTYKDEVQLSGFVSRETIKQKAGRVAARVSNVKKVINNIIVK